MAGKSFYPLALLLLFSWALAQDGKALYANTALPVMAQRGRAFPGPCLL